MNTADAVYLAIVVVAAAGLAWVLLGPDDIGRRPTTPKHLSIFERGQIVARLDSGNYLIDAGGSWMVAREINNRRVPAGADVAVLLTQRGYLFRHGD